MKISILTPDFSRNCYGRAWLLAKVLRRHYEVEIIGPKFGNEIWRPLAEDNTLILKSVNGAYFPKFLFKMPKLLNFITGDVIYVSKPIFSSFDIGLLKKAISSRPLVLDIDDWEIGFFLQKKEELFGFKKRIRWINRNLKDFVRMPNSYWGNLLNEKMIKFANDKTTSNSFLKEMYGGTIVPHGRDTHSLNPQKFNRDLLRKKFEVQQRKAIIFLGTPQFHKGIEVLINAIDQIKDSSILLMLVLSKQDSYQKKLKDYALEKLGDEGVQFFDPIPFKSVPEFLAIADLIVIPQIKNYATIGQVPAKIFDAMAMAKPIIATNVSDLAEILDGCGWIVESSNPEQLAEKIQYVFKNYEEAVEMGQKARVKCVKKYSWDAMGKILLGIFKKYEP